MKTTLHPFQLEGVKRIHKAFGIVSLLADEVGLGKSVQALAVGDRYIPDDPPGPVVIVCPAHLKVNWQREVFKHLGKHAEILRGRRAHDDDRTPSDPNAHIIVNYDILCPPNWKSRTAPPKESWLRYLMRLKPRLVVFDEGHLLSNPSSMRTRACRRMARAVEHKMILTGTPISNKPMQLWSLLNILRPDLYPSRHEFASTYSYGRRYWWGWQYKGARDLDKMHDQLTRNVMVRRRKADVLEQLPAVTYSVVLIEVDLREYHKAEMDFIGWLQKEAPLTARSAAKAEELNKMGFLKRMAGRLKIDAVIEWVDNFLEDTDAKLLLGAIHYAVTGPLMDVFGSRAVLVDGRISDREKDARTTQFNTDRNTRLCVANLNAGGTGWNCTATSDVAICEFPWIPGDIVQFSGRVHGIERGIPGTAAHVRFLVAADTIEADLCRVLQLKNQWTDQAIDGIPHSDTLPVHDLVKELIRARTQRTKGLS